MKPIQKVTNTVGSVTIVQTAQTVVDEGCSVKNHSCNTENRHLMPQQSTFTWMPSISGFDFIVCPGDKTSRKTEMLCFMFSVCAENVSTEC